MLKSLTEFQALTGIELARIVEQGPVLVTHEDEPRFVTQSVEAFEAMVRQLRTLQSSANRKRARSSGESQKGILLHFRR